MEHEFYDYEQNELIHCLVEYLMNKLKYTTVKEFKVDMLKDNPNIVFEGNTYDDCRLLDVIILYRIDLLARENAIDQETKEYLKKLCDERNKLIKRIVSMWESYKITGKKVKSEILLNKIIEIEKVFKEYHLMDINMQKFFDNRLYKDSYEKNNCKRT